MPNKDSKFWFIYKYWSRFVINILLAVNLDVNLHIGLFNAWKIVFNHNIIKKYIFATKKIDKLNFYRLQ